MIQLKEWWLIPESVMWDRSNKLPKPWKKWTWTVSVVHVLIFDGPVLYALLHSISYNGNSVSFLLLVGYLDQQIIGLWTHWWVPCSKSNPIPLTNISRCTSTSKSPTATYQVKFTIGSFFWYWPKCLLRSCFIFRTKRCIKPQISKYLLFGTALNLCFQEWPNYFSAVDSCRISKFEYDILLLLKEKKLHYYYFNNSIKGIQYVGK